MGYITNKGTNLTMTAIFSAKTESYGKKKNGQRFYSENNRQKQRFSTPKKKE